ncbi:hypothetical protein MRX96_013248 [Rhipicephalus microplus]
MPLGSSSSSVGLVAEPRRSQGARSRHDCGVLRRVSRRRSHEYGRPRSARAEYGTPTRGRNRCLHCRRSRRGVRRRCGKPKSAESRWSAASLDVSADDGPTSTATASAWGGCEVADNTAATTASDRRQSLRGEGQRSGEADECEPACDSGVSRRVSRQRPLEYGNRVRRDGQP